MSIWFGDINLGMLNDLNRRTLGEHLSIVFTEIGPDYLSATMPVEDRVRQPFGLLHGGATVALAETVGSVATWCVINREQFIGVGMEINANHLKPVTTGFVTAICSAIKVVGRVHVWDIRVFDAEGALCCICRFTVMVVPRPK